MAADNLGLLTQVMNKLLQPGVQISDDQVSKLVKYFTGMKDPVTQELFNHVLQLWFTEAVELWETRAHPCSEIFTLSLNIAVYLSSGERSFTELNKEDLFQRFIRLLKLALKGLNASPDVGYVRLMISFLKHEAGVQWLLSESYWSEIVDLALGNGQDPILVGECYRFIAQLIEKSALLCSNLCPKILYKLFKPVIDFVEVTNIRGHFEEEEVLKDCSPTINLLSEVLEKILLSKNVRVYEHVVKCIDKYEFEDQAYVVLQKLTNRDACYQVMRMMNLICVIDFITNCKGIAVLRPEEIWVKATKIHRFRKEIDKTKLFLSMQRLLHNNWKISFLIRDIHPKFLLNNNLTSPLEQLIYCQMSTVALVSVRLFGQDYAFEGHYDTFRGSIMNKYYRRAIPLTLYFINKIKNYFRDHFNFNDCILALASILKGRQYFERNEAKIVLIFCIYNYEDVSQAIDDEAIFSDPLALEYLAVLIETITTFLIDFDLNWQDISQELTLINITLKLLVSSNSTEKIIRNGLDLMRIAVAKKLSLNMALLNDEMDEEMDQLLTICVEKIDDENSEIQSAAIRVIESISQSVGKNFLTFKPMILSKHIPVKIAAIAVERKNHLLEASAFRCLQEMAKVEEFWSAISTYSNIYEDVSRIVIDATPEIVRREAAKLISIIYDQRDLTNAELFRFYDVMTYSVIEDTDTDTRINALGFWRNVVCRHLTDQGWIDGKFPDVTFSVDTKKIVIMSDHEIRKRLVKVLFQLSEIGCLFALSSAFADQRKRFCDTAYGLGKELLQLLNDYKVDTAVLKDTGYQWSSFSSEVGYDCDMEIHKKIVSRKSLHPKYFLDSVEIFLNRFEDIEIPDQQFDIVSILEEILYEGHERFLVHEREK